MAKKTNPEAYGKARYPKSYVPPIAQTSGPKQKKSGTFGEKASKAFKFHSDVISNIAKLAGAGASVATILKIAGVLNDPKWYENYDLLHSYSINKYLPWSTLGKHVNAALQADPALYPSGLPMISRIVSYEVLNGPAFDNIGIQTAATELYSKMRALSKSSTPYTVDDVAKYIFYVLAYRIFLNMCLKYLRIGHTSSGDDGLYQEYLGQASFKGNTATPQPGLRTTTAADNSMRVGTALNSNAFRANYGTYAPQIKAMLDQAATFYNANLPLEADILRKVDVENQYVFIDSLAQTGVVSTFKNMIIIPFSQNDAGNIVPLYTSALDSSYAAFNEPLARAFDFLTLGWGNGATFGAIAGDLRHTFGENYGYKFDYSEDLATKPIVAVYDELFNTMLQNITMPCGGGYWDTTSNYQFVNTGNPVNTLIPTGQAPFNQITSKQWGTYTTMADPTTTYPVPAGIGIADIANWMTLQDNALLSVGTGDNYTDGELAEIISLRGRLDVRRNSNTGDYEIAWKHGLQTILSADIFGEAYLASGTINNVTTLCGLDLGTGTVYVGGALAGSYLNTMTTFIDNFPITVNGSYRLSSSGVPTRVTLANYNVDAMSIIPSMTYDAVTAGATASLVRGCK